MREGRIEQDAAPAELFTRPATPFVARFMGYENLFPVQQGALKAGLEADGLTLQMHGVADSVTHLAWRPSSVPVVAADAGALRGVVLARSYLGETR